MNKALLLSVGVVGLFLRKDLKEKEKLVIEIRV